MNCPYCKTEKLIKTESKLTNFVTLECGHSIRRVEAVEVSTSLVKIEPRQESLEVISKKEESLAIPEKVEEPKEEVKVKEPRIKSRDGRIPYEFQDLGIDFIRDSGFRALIADEMGLGKTIQALGTLKLYPEQTLPVLILVKSALKIQWFSEVVRWCGVKNYFAQVIENGKDGPVEGFDVYIASYDILRRFTKKSKKKIKTDYGMEVEKEIKTNPFYTFPFKTIILDEAQSIKNIKSTRTEEVFKICEGKTNVIALSGTPFKNNIMEYFPILHLLNPAMFPSEASFERNWVKYGWIGSSYKPVGLKDLEYFKQKTSSFIIRRERKEVLPQLPEINRVFQHVDFETEKLKREYQTAEAALIDEYETKARNKNPIELLGIMAVVRHIVGINKVQPTVEKITEFLLDTDRKLVVFTHHQDVMDLIHLLTSNWCLDSGYEVPLKYSSSLTSDERNEVIKKFRDDPNARVMIASTLAAGEGLNLQFCSDCIIVERQWNPANEEQAEGRFIRIGQERNQVNAMYMIVSGTMDEWFTQLVEDKRKAFKSVMSGEQSFDQGSLLEDLMRVIIAKGRTKTMRGF